jgi:hypothetical protein
VPLPGTTGGTTIGASGHGQAGGFARNTLSSSFHFFCFPSFLHFFLFSYLFFFFSSLLFYSFFQKESLKNSIAYLQNSSTFGHINQRYIIQILYNKIIVINTKTTY